MDNRRVAGRLLRRPVDIEDLPESERSLSGRFTHDDAQIAEFDQPDVVGQGSLHNVVVSRSALPGSRLIELELIDVSFSNVVLANSSWDKVTAKRVELLNCQAVGLQLTLTKAEDLYFEDCKLDYARVEIEQHRGVVAFQRCTFIEATLDGDLSGVIFSDCEFKGVEFRARRATNCDLTTSRLNGASGLLTLVGARITDEQAMAISAQLATEAGFVIT